MLEFTVETELLAEETRVVSVAGELDMYTAPTFEDQIFTALGNGPGRVVVDLSGCDFLDSTALGILVAANKRLGEQRNRLVLVSSDHNILRAFEIAGLDGTFTIVPTRASAMNGATHG